MPPGDVPGQAGGVTVPSSHAGYAVTVSRRRHPDQLQNEIEELVSDLWALPRFAGKRHGFRPAVDCFRTADPPELTVVVELPGVDPATIEIVAGDRTLDISGERPRPRGSGRTYQQVELQYGPFGRRIGLTDEVDTSAATASYARGLLTVTLPIAERPPRPARVSIAVRTRA